MFDLKKLFVVCASGGLVLLTGPLSLTAAAQGGYVDLEAEAAAREASGQAAGSSAANTAQRADPFGSKPAKSYPATSYGVSTSPTSAGSTDAPGTTSAGAQPGVQPSSGSQYGQSAMGNLVLQVQQLQQEVLRLNGKLEEQGHELRTLKEQSMQRYVDLDKRLSGGVVTAASGAGNVAASAGTATSTAPVAQTDSAAGEDVGSRSSAPAQPGEKSAYDAAYGLVAGKQFENAIPAFQQFLRSYPDGKFAPNAHYWLGELYLVLDPPDLESARQSFAILISEYPEHAKAPDALYKLGKVQFMKGNREKAREYLDLVIAQYSQSNSAVVRLAQDFIAENY